MNRTLASWIVANPGGAVVLTGLLGLLPLFGLGFAFFLPGAVPALVVLQRDLRAGVQVAAGALRGSARVGAQGRSHRGGRAQNSRATGRPSYQAAMLRTR